MRARGLPGGAVALLLAVAWGRGVSAQAEASIAATAQVVDAASSESTAAVGARMVRVEPARLEQRRRSDIPGSTIFLDGPLDSAAAPARRITIIYW
jgi:hypothetical protein